MPTRARHAQPSEGTHGNRCLKRRKQATCGQQLAPKHTTGCGASILRSETESLSSGGRYLHDHRRAHSQLQNLEARRLARARGVSVILRRVRANSGARRAHLSVRVRNSLRQPSDARHVGQNDSRSGQHVDVGGADLLPKRGGGGELAQGEGSQGRWGKPRAAARGLTGVRCRAAAHGRGPLASQPSAEHLEHLECVL